MLETESLKLESPQDCNELNTAMERVGIETHDWTKKMVGFGSDGAAVMTGKKGGVIAKLKADQHGRLTSPWCKVCSATSIVLSRHSKTRLANSRCTVSWIRFSQDYTCSIGTVL